MKAVNRLMMLYAMLSLSMGLTAAFAQSPSDIIIIPPYIPEPIQPFGWFGSLAMTGILMVANIIVLVFVTKTIKQLVQKVKK